MDSDSSGLSDPPSSSPSPPSPVSSELSPVPSRSPSPGYYLTPDSTQDQDPLESESSEGSKKRKKPDEETPTAKKRKRPEPKPRVSQKLDLTQNLQSVTTNQKDQLELLLKVLRTRRKIVVVAGAGISVSAGIPDFRSSTGLFKSLKTDHKLKASGKQLFDASVYQTDSSTSSFHDMVRNLSGLVSSAKPTAFHQMLSTLGTEGRLMRLYTQNVDGIDVSLPSLETTVPLSRKGPWPRTVQLHGGLEKMVCSKCRALSNFEPALFNGPEPPPCESCVEADRVRTDHAGKRSHGIGRLRPRIVLYNEHNPDEEAIGGVVSADLRSRPDAVIVVGTSMKIPGVRRIVREMCGVVRSRRDGLSVWINHDGPPPGKEFEDCWDLVVKGPCDEVARQWDMSLHPHEECSRSDINRAKDALKVEVQINKAGSRKTGSRGIMTPAASPQPKPKPKLKINLLVRPKSEQVMKKAPHIPGERAKAKRKVKHIDGSTSQSTAKINQQFKATKPNSRLMEISQKRPDIGPLRSLPTSNPKFPVPILDARNNSYLKDYLDNHEALGSSVSDHVAKYSYSKDSNTTFPDTKTSVGVAPTIHERPVSGDMNSSTTPAPMSGPLSSHRGTISPTSIPKGMDKLLHP